MKDVLSAIWSRRFKGEDTGIEALKRDLKNCGITDVEDVLEKMKKDGLLESDKKGFALTATGRRLIKVVVCGGVFDILHPGHVFILDEAKSMGNVLVVIVAKDSTVEKRKRIPIVPEEQRKEMVAALKPVDVCTLGYEGDPLKIIEEIRPDIIALGPDQHHDEERIKKEMGRRGVDLEVRRIGEYRECELNSTKAILQRIIERNYPDSRSGG